MTAEYMVFIAYDEGTGLDLAEHLRTELKSNFVPSFVAKKDISSEIKQDKKWREIVDKVIETCNTFILIMTTDRLSSEVARETKKAFDRSKNDAKFSILICHLDYAPRTDQQLLKVGIDSKEYQQVDFTNRYDLARKVVLDSQGFPKGTIASEEGPNVLFDFGPPNQGSTYSGAPVSWNLPFTFSNRGPQTARISESEIRLLVEGPVNNIIGSHHGLGPQDKGDFFVKPGDPITGVSTVDIKPRTPALDWGKQYVEAYRTGKMKLSISIHLVVSDEVFHNKKTHDETIVIP